MHAHFKSNPPPLSLLTCPAKERNKKKFKFSKQSKTFFFERQLSREDTPDISEVRTSRVDVWRRIVLGSVLVPYLFDSRTPIADCERNAVRSPRARATQRSPPERKNVQWSHAKMSGSSSVTNVHSLFARAVRCE